MVDRLPTRPLAAPQHYPLGYRLTRSYSVMARLRAILRSPRFLGHIFILFNTKTNQRWRLRIKNLQKHGYEILKTGS